MSYQVTFKGTFVYNNNEDLEQALQVIQEEEQNPDESEMNALTQADFTHSKETTALHLDYDGYMPATCWYGCQRVLYKMSTKATKGSINCRFEGDEEEVIEAGHGW